MKTKKLEKNAEKNGGTGRFGLYWAAVLAFWAFAFALGVVRISELGASYPWGGIAVFALGALILTFALLRRIRGEREPDSRSGVRRNGLGGRLGTLLGGAPFYTRLVCAQGENDGARPDASAFFGTDFDGARRDGALARGGLRARWKRRFGRDGIRLSRDSRSVRRFLRDDGARVRVGCV